MKSALCSFNLANEVGDEVGIVVSPLPPLPPLQISKCLTSQHIRLLTDWSEDQPVFSLEIIAIIVRHLGNAPLYSLSFGALRHSYILWDYIPDASNSIFLYLIQIIINCDISIVYYNYTLQTIVYLKMIHCHTDWFWQSSSVSMRKISKYDLGSKRRFVDFLFLLAIFLSGLFSKCSM